MYTCPSCAAPLDDEGICTACGALSRGYFRGLDLGAPQVAAAVSRGLDFYRLLEVERSADTHLIARRYRRLRVLFPDDPSHLAPEPARKLELLEVAGRVLTDPALRRIYDELRQGRAADLRAEVVRCAACSAPLDPAATACAYCGTPRPAEHAPPEAPPEAGPLAAEPADYYSLLGLAPMHLMSAPREPARAIRPLASGMAAAEAAEALRARRPPDAAEVDAASYERQRETLLLAGMTPEAREARLAELELARRILRDDRLRSRYDGVWSAMRRGELSRSQLDALADVQRDAQGEGEAVAGAAEGAGLLRQGLGYLEAGLPGEALDPLRRARAALPDSAQAHAAYARALLTSADPLDLGAHALRQAAAAIDRAAELGEPPPNRPALLALCRGLLARDAGDSAAAEQALHEATRHDGSLAAAWRGLAALALVRRAYDETVAYCRRALATDPRDERALLMVAAACLRARQHAQARSAAEQVAALRGAPWEAADVLDEIA